MRNLAEAPEGRSVREEMEARLADAMAERKDTLGPCSGYRSWFDFNRRVVRNAHGALPHPESEPDWSLLR
ncbi:MAG: hypothetical protein BWZ10_03294 [candidate division BRC1 bacterium ADurb.BinA364]|nr:MAG: hypothetical protein BWZ10_03294 [candidate division BRC1 bacterium ADurb.BinA364]